jgi:hypothetical protein
MNNLHIDVAISKPNGQFILTPLTETGNVHVDAINKLLRADIIRAVNGSDGDWDTKLVQILQKNDYGEMQTERARILKQPKTYESLGVLNSYQHGGITAEMFAIGGTRDCWQFVVLQRGNYESLNCYFVARAWQQDGQRRYSDTSCHTAYNNHNGFVERMSILYTAYRKERKIRKNDVTRYGIPNA